MLNTGFGLRAAHTQARRHKRKKLMLTMTAVVMCLSAAYLGYRLGAYHTELIHDKFLKEIEAQSAELSNYHQHVEDLQQKTELAKAEAQTWQERYTREIPSGPTKELYDILTKKIEEGVQPDRLSFVLRNVQEAPKCLDTQIAKKIPIGIKDQKSAEQISFFDGAVLLQGIGTAAQNQKGDKEFWFNPKNSISMTLTHVTGEKKEITGKLPFHTLLQVSDKAYHFNFRAGPKGYCFVTATLCDYP